MKQIKDKIIGYFTFCMVLFVHIYFALLLGTKPAMAQEPVAEPVKAEGAAPAKIQKPTAPKPPEPPKVPSREDTEINIKIDPKDGISVKGLDKMVEKLEALDKKMNEAGDESHTLELGGMDELSDNHKTVALAGIMIPIMGILFMMAVVLGYMYFRYKARKDALETIKLFVEKGQPIPPEMMSAFKGQTSSGAGEWDKYQSHLLKGLKPIFWGVGILLFIVLVKTDLPNGLIFPVIFILIGAYHITKSYLIQQEKEKIPAINSSTDTAADKKNSI